MVPSIDDNFAAWQKAPKDGQLWIGPGPPYAEPANDEVVIKSILVAVNPIDWKVSCLF